MKYSINTNFLKTKLSIAEIVDLAVKLKVDGIEWGLPKFEDAVTDIKEMHERTSDAGLEVVGFLNGGKLWKKDEVEKWSELVASVNGKNLRVAHPWIAYNFDESLHQEHSFNKIFDNAKAAVPHLEELSRKYGIRFVVETHGGALVASTLAGAQLFEGADPECVGVIYDPANTFLEGGVRPRSEVEILGKYMAYVHAKNAIYYHKGQLDSDGVERADWKHKIVTPAEGIVDWIEVFYALKLYNYNGYISMEEFFGKGENDYEDIKAGLEFLKECEEHAPAEAQEPFTNFN
ncbi:MAG: sugar phosphate isomerase/epimerase family protein [Planctomycetota bacterium]